MSTPNTNVVAELDDPRVTRTARWLERCTLGNGDPFPIPEGGLADLIAQAVINYQRGWIYDADRATWSPRTVLDGTVSELDVTAEPLDEHAIRLTHGPTGITALAESYTDALTMLRTKVKEAADAE